MNPLRIRSLANTIAASLGEKTLKDLMDNADPREFVRLNDKEEDCVIAALEAKGGEKAKTDAMDAGLMCTIALHTLNPKNQESSQNFESIAALSIDAMKYALAIQTPADIAFKNHSRTKRSR